MSTSQVKSKGLSNAGISSPVALSIWLMLVTLALYWPATTFEFSHFDDQTYYTQNDHVRAGLGWDGIRWAFTTGTASNWHPITWLSHMLDADLADGVEDVWVPHFTNILLHAADSALLFAFLRRATRTKWRSLMVAGLFALHPLNVESVAWVAERKNVLSQFFFFAALLAYGRYVEEFRKKPKIQNSKSTVFYGASLAAFALALMSKPMVVTLPFVLMLLDVWPLKRTDATQLKLPGWPIPRFLWVEKGPFFVLSILVCVVTYLVQQHGAAVQSSDFYPLPGRVENALISYVRYLGKTFWPMDLAIYYPYQHSWPPFEVALASVLMGLVSLASIRWWREAPYLLVGWFWFVGTLIPVIGLVQVGHQSMADRYAYLPLIGIFIVVVWGGFELLDRVRLPRPGMLALAGAGLLACALATRCQLGYWQNDGTLFGHALAITTNNVQAELTLGVYLQKVNQPAEAEKHYRSAVAIDPDDKTAHFDLADVLDDEHQTEAAMKEYRETIRCDPTYYPAYYNLGLLLEQAGRRDEAVAEYEAALKLKPDLDQALQRLQALGAGRN